MELFFFSLYYKIPKILNNKFISFLSLTSYPLATLPFHKRIPFLAFYSCPLYVFCPYLHCVYFRVQTYSYTPCWAIYLSAYLPCLRDI